MEKSSAGIRKFWLGLLGILFLELSGFIPLEPLHAALPWSYIQSLRFRSSDSFLFTLTDCQFTLDIENVSPDKVVVYSNTVPSDVSFSSSRKETYVPKSEDSFAHTGTHLIVSFKFEKPGSYQIPPLEVRIDGQYCTIPVEPVYVYENPSVVKPELEVSFDSPSEVSGKSFSVNAREHVSFTLYIRYAVQITQFSWDIPEDSLFKETRRFEITQGVPRGTDFSPNLVPVASFDWQPLVPGTFTLPQISLIATSYSGIRYSVQLPKYTVNVLPVEAQAVQKEEEDSIFAYAFAAPPQETEAVKFVPPAEADLHKLLELHKKERYSVPLFSKAREQRQQAEKKAGLTPAESEPNVPVFFALVILSVVALIALILLLIFKKIPYAAVAAFLFMLFASLSVVFGLKVSERYAVFAGSKVSPIPEDSVLSSINIPAGSLVKIEREAGGWMFIRYNDTYGWVKNDSLYLLNGGN